MDDPDRRKRSRFDQTEPEPRRSRFDRRSRSPPRRSDQGRDRSPLKDTAEFKSGDGGGVAEDPAAAAGKFSIVACCDDFTDSPVAITAAAAAKINAQIQAKKGIQHADVPPIRSSGSEEHAGAKINGEMYVADGDYIKDIEVNDLRNRYTLTKGSTQKMVTTSGYAPTDTLQITTPPKPLRQVY
jgi:hypothetical protein